MCLFITLFSHSRGLDFGDNYTYLPLQWIDLLDIDEYINDDILRTTQEIDRRSLGGKKPSRDKTNGLIQELSSQSESLQNTLNLLQDMPFDRLAKVAGFYNDFIVSLEKITSSLAENGYMVWTIGNRRVNGLEIPNDQILIELLTIKGFELIVGLDRIIHNKRMPHKNQIAQMMRSEKILVFGKN